MGILKSITFLVEKAATTFEQFRKNRLLFILLSGHTGCDISDYSACATERESERECECARVCWNVSRETSTDAWGVCVSENVYIFV